jgi:hypothetical protein
LVSYPFFALSPIFTLGLAMTDMRKRVGAWSLATEISWICGNFKLAALNCSLICFVKLKYYVSFNYITQIIHSNAHFNPFQGVFSDKLLIFVEILSFQFAEIFNSFET